VSAYGRLAEGGEPEDVMEDRIPALQVALALLERDCAATVTATMLKSTLIGWSALFKVRALLTCLLLSQAQVLLSQVQALCTGGVLARLCVEGSGAHLLDQVQCVVVLVPSCC
jgi:hypothetical protein